MKLRTENTSLRKKMMQGNRFRMVGLILVTLINAGMNLWISWLLQTITDAIVDGTLSFLLRLLCLVLFSLAVVSGVMLLERRLSAAFVKKAMCQYKDAAFLQITSKKLCAFSSEGTGTYISALTNDVASIEANYIRGTLELVVQTAGFIGAFVMMLCYSPLLTAAAVLLALVPLTASILCGSRLAKAELQVSEENAHFVSTVKDILSGFPVIKSFHAQQEAHQWFGERNEGIEQVKYKRNLLERLISLIGNVAGFIAQMGVFFVGAALALQGKGITPGILVAFVNLMNLVVTPIGSIPQLLGNRKAAKGLINRLEGLLAENTEEQGGQMIKAFTSELSLQSVSFGYDQTEKILKNINYVFEAGKSYAIVGSSGSGKSTLLHLLMGNYDDYDGSMTIDGVELRTVEKESLQKLISMIRQDVFIFNSSIYQNITLFCPFEEADIDRAVLQSGLKELIKEKGMDYICGEGGCNLSGGERQRISIARSLLHHAPILLVDEATAALDSATAYAVSKEILAIPDLTKIVVTHNLEPRLLARYDEILVLKNGEIVEHGSYDRLLEQKRYLYALMLLTD